MTDRLSWGAMAILKTLSKTNGLLTAKEIAGSILSPGFSKRSSSASVAGTCRTLIQRKFVARFPIRYELYAYAITAAGRAFLESEPNG